MAGRPRKPTKLKEAAGWPGHHPKPKGEPQPTPDIGDCPPHLKGLARDEWNRLAPELKNLGLLTVVDRAGLESYCVAYARWRSAEKELCGANTVIKNRWGDEKVNPLFTVAHKSMEILRRVAVEFGFTPASRSKVTSDPGEEDPDDAFFKEGRRKIGVVQ